MRCVSAARPGGQASRGVFLPHRTPVLLVENTSKTTAEERRPGGCAEAAAAQLLLIRGVAVNVVESPVLGEGRCHSHSQSAGLLGEQRTALRKTDPLGLSPAAGWGST